MSQTRPMNTVQREVVCYLRRKTDSDQKLFLGQLDVLCRSRFSVDLGHRRRAGNRACNSRGIAAWDWRLCRSWWATRLGRRGRGHVGRHVGSAVAELPLTCGHARARHPGSPERSRAHRSSDLSNGWSASSSNCRELYRGRRLFGVGRPNVARAARGSRTSSLRIEAGCSWPRRDATGRRTWAAVRAHSRWATGAGDCPGRWARAGLHGASGEAGSGSHSLLGSIKTYAESLEEY